MWSRSVVGVLVCLWAEEPYCIVITDPHPYNCALLSRTTRSEAVPCDFGSAPKATRKNLKRSLKNLFQGLLKELDESYGGDGGHAAAPLATHSFPLDTPPPLSFGGAPRDAGVYLVYFRASAERFLG